MTQSTITPAQLKKILFFLLCASGALAQQASKSADAPADADGTSRRLPVAVPASTLTGGDSNETVMLSPFEVSASTRGYFAANSMSGTRFNSKVEDLASSLTVVTTEVMDDFGMLDINDVFHITAGTEGTTTFTDYTIDRNGQLTDNVQLDPQNANRIRGILSANRSYGNFEINRLPMDRLTIGGIEISRGPNANVFGLGYAAGTTNLVPGVANLSRNKARSEVRADSYGGYRTTLDVNSVIKPGVLALRVNGGFQHDAFQRKPSGMNTVVYNGFLKYQPFKNTSIGVTFLHNRSNGNRPNFTPPRDYISDWVAAGKPTWDPILQVFHLNGQTIDSAGVVSGGRAISPINTDAKIPSYIPVARGNSTRNNVYIDNETGLEYWSVPGASSVSVAVPTPTANSQSVRLMSTNVFGSSGGKFTGQPLWSTTPTIGDHSYYDWHHINLSSPNRQMDSTNALLVNLDQVLLNTDMQTLFVQAAFLREGSQRFQRQPLGNSGISGQTGQYYVDIDEKRLDGTPNPFFLRPYIAAGEFTTRYVPSRWDTYRLQAAYQLDLTRSQSWLKWLGLHQLTTYSEYKERVTRQWSYRQALASNHSWTSVIAANQNRSNQSNVTGGIQASPNITRSYFRYYVGDAGSTDVQYAPGDFKEGSYPFVWGGYRTISSSGVVDTSTGVFSNENATLALLPTTDQTGGNYNLKQIIKTPGGVLQSHFLDGKIVSTFGLRQDKVFSKNGINAVTPTTPVAGANLNNDYSDFDWDYTSQWQPGPWRANTGRTTTAGVVVRPFRDFAFLNRASSRTGPLSWLAQAFQGLSLTYNQSDNFYPQAPAIDLFRNQLPSVTGEGKDYGFWMNLFNDKVVIRFNHYITKQLNIRNGDANTIAQRALRLDLDISSDHFQLYDRADNWWRLTHPEWTDAQVRNAIAEQMQIPVDEYSVLQSAFTAGSIAATNDYIASGNEVEINVNPTRYWRLTGSVTEQKAVTANISNMVQDWIDRRVPVWTTIVDQNFDPNLGGGVSAGWAPTADNPNHLWWIHGYNGTSVAKGYFDNNVAAPFKVIKQQEGKSKPSVRKYQLKLATSLDLGAFTSNKIVRSFRVGVSGNWQDKGAIGYYGVQKLPAVVTDLDPDNPVWDKARLYVNAFVSYRTKMFGDRVAATYQLNVENIGENGRLQPIGAFPDGTPNAFRIVDPQKFILSASFDL